MQQFECELILRACLEPLGQQATNHGHVFMLHVACFKINSGKKLNTEYW